MRTGLFTSTSRGEGTIKACAVCGKTEAMIQGNLKACSECKTTYCSRECQEKEWREYGHGRRCKELRKVVAGAAAKEPDAGMADELSALQSEVELPGDVKFSVSPNANALRGNDPI